MVPSVKVETEIKNKLTINGQDANEVLELITDCCHEMYRYVSDLNDEHNDGKPLSYSNIERIEGCLNEILDILGD